MSKLYFEQWRDGNSTIAYPFGDDTKRRSLDGRLEIPNDWLVDASVYSPLCQGVPYISQLELTESDVVVTLADNDGQILGTGRADKFSTNPIAILDTDDQPIAILVVGDGGSSPLFVNRPGVYRFLPEATELVISCVFWPTDTGFKGFEIDGERLIGSELNLVGERGIQITTEETLEVQPTGEVIPVQLIRFHAVGDPQYLTRECPDASQRPNRFVREIVFQYGDFTHICRPDRTGNIMFFAGSPTTATSALKITTEASKIIMGLMGTSIR